MDEKFLQAIKPISPPISVLLKRIPPRIQSSIQEVRLRKDKPLVLVGREEILFLTATGQTSWLRQENLVTVTANDIDETLRAACAYSLHSHTREIASGFVTVEGGHRVGICGTAVYENGKLANQRQISSLNIRIAREFNGVADPLITSMQGRAQSLLLAGAPSTGKTTVLRDLARQLSGQERCRCKISVIDERSEIAAMCRGIPQNDVGINTDVLDGFSKGEGITQAVRTLSPDVIICDEIGTVQECEAIKTSVHCGVKFIASVHASSMEELMRKPLINDLLSNHIFEKLAFLKTRGAPSQIEDIICLTEGKTL